MGIFTNLGGNYSGSDKVYVAPPKCVVDYEALIVNARGKVNRYQALLDALHDVTDTVESNMDDNFSIPELLGLLDLEIRKLNGEIARLLIAQEAQEEEAEKGKIGKDSKASHSL